MISAERKEEDMPRLMLRVGAALSVCVFATAPARSGDLGIATELVAVVNFPVYVTHAPADFDRIFIVGKHGVIRVVRAGQLLATSMLNIDSLVRSTENERGLIGLAFDPDFDSNGSFYVNYTSEPIGDLTLVRYTILAGNPDVADAGSALPVFSIPHPNAGHNAGWIGFGDDGLLYMATGDGGGGGVDPGNDAQSTTSLLGKILRLDVHGDGFPEDPLRNYEIPPGNPFAGGGGAGEIWALGLRNPWRASFDRLTGDMRIGDVGAAAWEELDLLPAGSPPGPNFGWDCREGTHCIASPDACACATPGLIDPIHEYPHEAGSNAIIGGYVYRGCAIPSLDGTYIFGDVDGVIWRLIEDGGGAYSAEDITDQLLPPSGEPIGTLTSFGEDALGEIYICDRIGSEVFRIVPAAAPEEDCNANGDPDACELIAGESGDVNGNGLPDDCDADLNGDGTVGISDLLVLLAGWGTPGPGDLDGSGSVGINDLLMLLLNWG